METHPVPHPEPPAMLPTFILYCLLIAGASVVGGLIPLMFRLTHLRVQVALSFVSGVLIGVGLLHMLPHAFESGVSPHEVCLAAVLGFMTIFLLERFFSFHHHEVPSEETTDPGAGSESEESSHTMGWVGAFFGMTIHTLVAGVALASATVASFESEPASPGTFITLAGFGTFLGVFLHKPFDSLTIATLMRAGRHSRLKTMVVNLLFALVIPLGVVLFFLVDDLGEQSRITGYALGFSAGTFLCIGGSDLLPELQFHKHNRILLTVCLVLGLVTAWASGLLEHHDHDHAHGHHHGHHHGHDHHGHDHHGHDHHDHDQGHGHDHDHDHDHPHPH
ncbi:MAG: ZIP family metal transporter [Planctomycetota bacterium]|nr:ZIP family metal transporter [Planctomycetota bacterium]